MFKFVVIVVMIVFYIPLALAYIWAFNTVDGGTEVKFEDFLKSYKVNSSRWYLKFDGLEFCGEGGEFTPINFSLIDYYRYRRWVSKEGLSEKSIHVSKKSKDVIDIIKSDIENYDKGIVEG